MNGRAAAPLRISIQAVIASPAVHSPPTQMTRIEAEQLWLKLTRETLPALAVERRWPVRHDHCFQRIILDSVHGGRWLDFVAGRPAYRAMAEDRLIAAIALAQAIVRGDNSLQALNAQSLRWRGKI